MDVTRDIVSRERPLRTRTSVLQSSGKVCLIGHWKISESYLYVKDEMFVFTRALYVLFFCIFFYLLEGVLIGFVFIFQQFLKNVIAILQSVKAQEEGKVKHLQNQDSLANTTVSLLKIAGFAFLCALLNK